MKMLSEYQTVETVTMDFTTELKRLHTAAESLVLAMRYVGIQTRDEKKLDTLLGTIAFVDEIRDEIRTVKRRGGRDGLATYAPNWALELALVSEERNLADVDDHLDTLLKCFAEACAWLNEMQTGSRTLEDGTIAATYFRLLDFVACGALAIISGKGNLCREAA